MRKGKCVGIPSPDFEGNGLAYLQACAEPSQDCRVFCADQSATFTTLCKLGDRGEVNNHCMQIPCPGGFDFEKKTTMRISRRDDPGNALTTAASRDRRRSR